MQSPEPTGSIDARRSTAILVGTSTYTGGLSSFAAAGNSLRRMKTLLIERCGWQPDRIHSFLDKTSADPVLRDIAGLIHRAEDAVLFYYVGHGQLIKGRQDLGLALSDTSTDRLLRRSTSLLLSNVKREFEDCEARIKLMMLDCCYSGLAVGGTAQGPPEVADEIHDLSRLEGVFTLTACRFNEQTYYQQGDGGLTYFTKFFAEIVEEGIAGPQAWLTGNAIYDALAGRLRDLRDPAIPELPRPEISTRGRAGEFPFAPNRAWRPGPAVVPPDPREAPVGRDVEFAREWVAHDRYVAERLAAKAAPRQRPASVLDGCASAESRLSIVIDQSPHLPAGHGRVDAIVTVARPPAERFSPPPAIVFIIDCTASMSGLFDVTKTAIRTALDALDDGSRFAVIAGRDTAELVYPDEATMATADAHSRAAAIAAVDGLRTGGSREFGLWLTFAARLFGADQGRVRKALLVTDGSDNTRHPADIKDVIRACAGVFTCDCRGVGTDWTVIELLTIANGLHGRIDIISDPARLPEALRRWTVDAMSHDLADVSLRVWTLFGTEIEFIKEVAPRVVDLADSRVDIDETTSEYATGTWRAESRDYHISLEVPQISARRRRCLATVSVVVPHGRHFMSLGAADIIGNWVDEEELDRLP